MARARVGEGAVAPFGEEAFEEIEELGVGEVRGQRKLRKWARSRAAMWAMAARRSVRMAQRVVVKLCIGVSYK